MSTPGAMTTTTPARVELAAAADDAQRMLLCCVLRDALERQHTIEAACADCQAAGDTCLRHWDAHEQPGQEYRGLQMRLEGYDGRPYGQAFPLTARDRQVIAAALAEAITFRGARKAAEDIALMAAYRVLRRELGTAGVVRQFGPARARSHGRVPRSQRRA